MNVRRNRKVEKELKKKEKWGNHMEKLKKITKK